MTIKELEEELEKMKKFVGVGWDEFRELEIEGEPIELTAICGEHLYFGLLPIFQKDRRLEDK